jgi:hypothetical protein
MERAIALVASLSLAAACGSSASSPGTSSTTALGTMQAGELNVELLSGGTLATGLNQMYVKLTDASGASVAGASLTLLPAMDMGSMGSMGAPVFGTPMTYSAGLYQCQVVFPAASGSMGSWSVDVTVQPSGGSAADADFGPLTVTDSGRAQTFTVGSTEYLISMNFAATPHVGLNPIVVTLDSSQDMGTTYTPVTDATFTLDPEMPSMGMGASESVNPTLASPGLYDGQVSFSMQGTWVTTVTVDRPGFTAAMSVAITTTL